MPPRDPETPERESDHSADELDRDQPSRHGGSRIGDDAKLGQYALFQRVDDLEEPYAEQDVHVDEVGEREGEDIHADGVRRESVS